MTILIILFANSFHFISLSLSYSRNLWFEGSYNKKKEIKTKQIQLLGANLIIKWNLMECLITRDSYIFSLCNNFSFIVEYLGPYVRTHSHLLFTHHATRGAKHMFFGQSESFLHSICAVMKKENMIMLLNKRDKRFV